MTAMMSVKLAVNLPTLFSSIVLAPIALVAGSIGDFLPQQITWT
jgi:multidrug efflux pump subunit AcrB